MQPWRSKAASSGWGDRADRTARSGGVLANGAAGPRFGTHDHKQRAFRSPRPVSPVQYSLQGEVLRVPRDGGSTKV